MSVRVRLFYEKRGGACFVPHVALAQLFTRAACRAGLVPVMTAGFSPHAKVSFGPELPAGVVALMEPVDIHLEAVSDDLIERWNGAMPDGFRIRGVQFPPEGAPSLGKECGAALYWLRSFVLTDANLAERARAHYGDAVLSAEIGAGESGMANGVSLVLSSPARNGIGGWVKAMIASGALAGWQEINVVRVAIGSWDGTKIELPGRPAL
ncbi:TIGR03936 family radical SAM-associated protein [Fretibacterium sp. OH1220_COT-178]|uniref:TIGR03936 family radical SAM-associated protein n=1 Tax=Fretibacterium sp. OH1220_COT-178 TaxID=2491047 RepID=UPI0013152389|nr:TIGR03936 family radical SAM-associated protein [Fretibacterium sp. OH1220_COT-178]